MDHRDGSSKNATGAKNAVITVSPKQFSHSAETDQTLSEFSNATPAFTRQ